MFINLETIWQMIPLFFGLAVFGFISWRRPDWGAALVIFLAPLYLLKIWGLPLTVLEVLIWVFVGEYLIKKISAARRPAGELNDFWLKMEKNLGKNYLMAAGLILLGVFLSAVFSSGIKTGLGVFKSWFLAPVAFSLILAGEFKEKEIKERILPAMAASAGLVAFIGLFYWFSGKLTFDGRLAAFFLSPNHLAMYLAPGFLIAAGLWLEAKKQWQEILLFIICCVAAVVLYFTYSYGAWLGILAALVFVLAFFWRLEITGRKKIFIACCLLAVIFFVIAFLQFDGEKIANLLNSDRSSWQSRLMVWRAAGEILKDHWVLGVGPGLFQPHYLEYQKFFPVPYLEWAVPQPHNLFLAWWLQAGILGLAGFIWLITEFFRRAWQRVRQIKALHVKTSEGGQLLIFLMAVMAYILVHGLVDTTFWKNDLSLIFWIIAFLGSRAARRAD